MCNDSGWKSNVSTCVLALCTVPESLTTFNASATMCDWPVRNRSHSLVATSTSLYAIMTFIVVARLVFKKFVVKSLSCDDWVMIVTAISATPTAAMAVYGKSNNNLGHDMWTLTVDQITHTLKCFYFTIITYFITTSLVKLTFVTFYIRIFPSVHTRRVLWGTCILICLNAVAFVLVGVFQCTPINAYWARWTEPETRHCIDLNAIAWSNAAINIALDLWILAIPLWELRRLQLHWKKKIGVGLMFSVGALYVPPIRPFPFDSAVGSSNTWQPQRHHYNHTAPPVPHLVWNRLQLHLVLLQRGPVVVH